MFLFKSLSRPGERDHNEDYVGTANNGDSYCFVLADGLGGHGGGDVASRLVSQCVLQNFEKNGQVTEAYMKQCFEVSQRALMEEKAKLHRSKEMMTTLVLLFVDSQKILWGHIGDSRLYCFKQKRMQLRTLDHSVPQMLVSAGQLKEKQIRGHADRNRLLRVMGTEWEQTPYELAEPMERMGGETFLLCSDGFWEWIKERNMQFALRWSDTPEEWLAKMEKTVLKHGRGNHMDNYSAIAVFL